MKRRLIGEIFPVKEVSDASSREKSIRHGHISTLHLWWARRPLASSRATIYASLVDPPKNIEEWGTKIEQIAELSKWENSLNHDMIERIQNEILENNGGIKPRVLDPFGGGGAIPLESLRLGCETYAGDINPVAVLIQKCTLEYPQKFGRSTKGDNMESKDEHNRLLADIKKWSDWVLDESRREIEKFYTIQEKNSTSVGYITARTIKCQNPKCGVEIPLISSYQFVRKKGKNISIWPYVSGKQLRFRIVGDGYEKVPDGFSPSKGTISNARAVCIACQTVVDPDTLKKLFWENKSYDKQIVTIISKTGTSGKTYRSSNSADHLVSKSTIKYLTRKKKIIEDQFMIESIPDEIIPTPENKEHVQGGSNWVFTPTMLYGMTKWRDLFNPRQTLSMIVFLEKVRQAHKLMLDDKYEPEYAKVISTYLAIMLDRLADKNSNLVIYNPVRETIEHVFGRQALQMRWDYVEINPFTKSGWHNIQNWVMKVVEHCSTLQQSAAKISQESSTCLSYEDNYFDAVFTDPPYYDNVPYSFISDFFYVWLKRSVGYLYPELFATPLTPKSNEVIANLSLVRGIDKDAISKTVKSIKTKKDFEIMLSKSFSEIYRVLKKGGITVIVYAHKSTDGWETLINSVLESGLVITASWPIHTEMKARMVAKESAALNSSIYMVARKTEKEDLGFYRDIKKGMSQHIESKLQYLWEQGISGSDFFISAIGISLEVFGKYNKVVDDNDQQITTLRLLDDVRKIVTNFAMNQVLHNDFRDTISHMTRFYILWRRAFGHAMVPFDDALKMAQSIGIDIEHEYDRGFIRKYKGFIKVLEPKERQIDELDTQEWIDILHKVVLLWKDNKRKQLSDVLDKTKLGGEEMFYKVARAISESVPKSDESKLLNGFLLSKNTIMNTIHKNSDQTKLNDYESRG